MVRDFDLIGVTVFPYKTDSRLIVDPKRVLSAAVAFETVEPVCGRNLEIFQSCCRIQHLQFATGNFSKIRRRPL